MAGDRQCFKRDFGDVVVDGSCWERGGKREGSACMRGTFVLFRAVFGNRKHVLGKEARCGRVCSSGKWKSRYFCRALRYRKRLQTL